MSDEPKRDFDKEFNLAEAEDSGRNLASIIVAFRDELRTNVFPEEVIDELTLVYGTAIVTRILLQTVVEEEEEE